MTNKQNGSVIVEFVLLIPMFVLIAGLLLAFVKTSLARLRGVALAHYGASLQATGLFPTEDLETELSAYHAALRLPGEWEMENGRFTDTPAARFYQLMKTSVEFRVRQLVWRETAAVQASFSTGGS